MAEITTSNNRHNKQRSFKKKKINIDLTPMVDLGFLLITFFVFTTTMAEAKAMDLKVPNDKDGPTSEICESCALTVIASKNNTLYYYEGNEEHARYLATNYSPSGIRDLIVQKKRRLLRINPNAEVQLIIKPTEGSTFKNLVDLVDEANICALKRYFIADPSAKDKQMTE